MATCDPKEAGISCCWRQSVPWAPCIERAGGQGTSCLVESLESLAEHQGEQGQVLVSFWTETDRFIPTKGVSHRKWSGVPQVLIRTLACPLSPPRWVGVGVRDCLTVAPHFWCVTCFWAEPGCLWGGGGQRCPRRACVPWKQYHTNVLHVPKWNLIFKNAPLGPAEWCDG